MGKRAWGSAGVVFALLATAAARAEEPGAPELTPTAASLDVLIPIITHVGTFVEYRRVMVARGRPPLIPIVTPHGTLVHPTGTGTGPGPDGGAAIEARGVGAASVSASVSASASESASESVTSFGSGSASASESGSVPPPRSADRGASSKGEGSVAGSAATAGAKVAAPTARPRSALSLALHYEAGYFGPADVNAELTARAGVERNFVLFGGLGLGLEVRPHPWVGLSATTSYLLAPPETINLEVHYLHAFAGTVAARLYVPTVDALDIAMGVEGSIHWAGYQDTSAVGPGFVWRFGVQLLDPDLPAVLATIYVRRAKLRDDDGFELDLSGIGAMADFSFDL
ncbi:MAG: hypothetical protein RMA76_13270 [Deltaproteobacteria bacterium]